MVCYENSIVYKLCCNDLNITEIYVGSTCNFLRRKQAHRGNCNNENSKEYNKKVYKFIRENGGFENWSMIQIEECNVKNKRELEQKERYNIEQLKAILNCHLPYKNEIEMKESRNKYNNEYYINNKEHIKEQTKQYCIDNKKKISDYYNLNREFINEKKKKYRLINKMKISDERKEKISCECGIIINKSGLSKHKKSIKHMTYINSL